MKALKITVIWMALGLGIGIFLAVLALGQDAVSVIFIPAGLFLGLSLGAIHCLSLFILKKNKNYTLLYPLGFLAAVFLSFGLLRMLSELSCNIKNEESLITAVAYVKSIGYDPKYLKKNGNRMAGCMYGFEYSSPEDFRLIIVNSDGQAKLND